MASPLTPADIEALLEGRRADFDAALLDVSPAGYRLGMAELEQIVGASANPDDPAGVHAFAEGAFAYLETFGLLEAVTSILQSAALEPPTADALANMSIAPAQGARFYNQAVLARCAILRGGTFKGSGCLVGPSLVLTCAHVVGALDDKGECRGVQVQLANNMLVGVEAKPLAYSPPAPADLSLPLSQIDSDFDGGSDYALLRLLVPAGSRVSAIAIPREPWPPTANAALTMLHFPRGQDRGVGQCSLTQFSNPKRRWGYTSPADNGSSGGPMFNTEGQLVGIHQGKFNPKAKLSRMIPAELFLETLGAAVELDLWPDYLWSLDGRLSGSLVIGRNDLFQAFRMMAAPNGQDRVFRVLRIKRADPTDTAAGLGYSVELVRRLIERMAAGHRELVLSWPQTMSRSFDILDELGKQALALELLTPEVLADIPGVAEGQTGQASVIKARADNLLRTIAQGAEQRGEIVWIVVEHANFPLGEQVVPLESLASIVQQWGHLRLVLVGNEVVNITPESRVSDLAQASFGGVTLVEYLGPLSGEAVEEFVAQVHEIKAGEPPSDRQRRTWSSKALRGVTPVGNGYPLSGMPGIASKLRDILGIVLPDEDNGAAA